KALLAIEAFWCPFPARVPVVDRSFPPRRHRWPTSSCARRPLGTPGAHPTSIRKAHMVRAIVYLFVAILVLGTIAVPGLGAFALVLAPLLGLGFLWRTALTVSTRGHSIDAVVHTRQSHLLGPGGPDDSFAASPFVEHDYPTRASAPASV